MKKIELIQITIIIVGILAGYSALQSLILILSTLAYMVDYSIGHNGSGGFLPSFLSIIVYTMSAVILIKNSKKIASSIIKDDESGGSTFINLDSKSIVFILLIGIGLYSLIQSAPYVIRDSFFLFKKAVSSSYIDDSIYAPKKDVFIIEILKVVIGFFIIYASPTLTNFINNKIALRLKS